MRTTTVPAQITTIEDTVAGELSITQLLLLVAPIFSSAALFILLPPFFNSAPYKIVIMVCLAVLSGTLAIRIKGKILLMWALVLLRYNFRPRYYLFNKNDAYLRHIPRPEEPEIVAAEAKPKKALHLSLPHISTADIVTIEQLIANPQANLHFKTTRKGGLRVHITEVQ
jgi:hypothetical protein